MKKYTLLFGLLLLIFGCDKEVSVTAPVENPENGFIYVSSNPVGVKIYLNGKNTGKFTPDSLTYVDYGDVEVKLVSEYLMDYTVNTSISEGERKTIFVDYKNLTNMYGSIQFSSSPVGCTIYINDSLTTLKTNAEINKLFPGQYTIRFSKAGYRDAVVSTSVKSQIKTNVYLTLQDTTIWADYKISNSGIPTNNLTCLEIDSKQKIWMGTASNGVAAFDRKTWSYFNKSNSQLPSNNIKCIETDELGNVWIGTDNGLVKYNESGIQVYTITNSNLPNNTIQDIASFGNVVWVATYSGLAKIENGNVTVFNTSNSSIAGNQLTCVAVSKTGVVYAGTTQNGIIIKDGDTFYNKSTSNTNIPSNYISTIEIENQNSIWFGHLPTSNEPGGISNLNNGVFTQFTTGLISNSIRAIVYQSGDVKYVGTDNGMMKIVGTVISKNYNAAPNQLTSNLIKGLCVDSNGSLWIATEAGGLCRFKP